MSRCLASLVLLALATPDVMAQADVKAGPLYDRALKAMAKAPTLPADKSQQEWERAVALLDSCIKVGDEKYTAKAAWYKALCYETMEPPRIQDALAAYGTVTAGDLAAKAADKVKRAGVDVYLGRFKIGLKSWRETDVNNEAAFLKLKTDTWEKITALGLGTKTAAGLIWALGDEESLLRDYAAEKLPDIVDGDGIAQMIEASRSPNPTLVAGVSGAIRRVMNVYAHAAGLDRQADEMEKKIQIEAVKLSGTDAKSAEVNAKFEELKAKLTKAIDDLRTEAKAVRKDIPEDAQGLVAVTEEIKKLIGDTKARLEARVEGVRISEEIGDLEGGIVDALLEVLKDPAAEMRAEAARALGAIKKGAVEDRLKAAKRLEEVVQYEPEKIPEGEKPDWKTNAFVRANAAYGLSRLGIVTSVPSLIEALEDNDARVRESSHNALIALRGMRISHPDNAAENLKGRDVFDADAPEEARKAGRDAWDEWWKGSQGVEVLVVRYRDFANSWPNFDTSLFYDRDYLVRRLTARGLIVYPDAPAKRAELLAAAEASMAEFTKAKDILKNEVVALGAAISDRLITFIGGELEGSKAEHPSLRLFVAQCMAEIGKQDTATKDKVRALLGDAGTTKTKQVGAAFSLGMLGEAAGDADRESLAKEGLALDGGPIREACARALGLIGAAEFSKELIGAAKSLNVSEETEERALVAICDAIGRGKKAGAAEIGELGGLASANDSPTVRESACWALGEIGKPEGLLFLVLARTDIFINVRLAAREAIKAVVGKADTLTTQLATSAAAKIAGVEAGRAVASRERAGACLALGDGAPAAKAGEISTVLLSVVLGKGNTKVLRKRFPPDEDAGVRTAAAEALGDVGSAAAKPPLEAIRGLIDALADKSPLVRAAALGSITRLAEKAGAEKLPDVDGAPYSAAKEITPEGIEALNQWATGNESKFGS